MGKTQRRTTTNAGYLEPSTYADGTPIDDIHYLECKLILKPDRFTSVQAFGTSASSRAARPTTSGSIFRAAAKQRGSHPRGRLLSIRAPSRSTTALILRRRIPAETDFPSASRRSCSSSGIPTCRGCRARRRPHPGRLPHQIQGRGAPREAHGRLSCAVLAQRGVRPERGAGTRSGVARASSDCFPRSEPRTTSAEGSNW